MPTRRTASCTLTGLRTSAVRRPDTLLSVVLCAGVVAVLLARWVPELLRPDPVKSVAAIPSTVVWEGVRPIAAAVCVAVEFPDGWSRRESVDKATVHWWSAAGNCDEPQSDVFSAGSAVERMVVPAGAAASPRRGYRVSVPAFSANGGPFDLTLDPALEYGESQMLAFVGTIGSVARPHDLLLVMVDDVTARTRP
ncbi:MAG: hypothetical protein ABR509_01740 [Candidatus Limnocylindria bacterium]